ncbi:MAG: hypothetical protein ACI4HI_14020 [Lachnospiraceae bacterium]
MPILKNGCMEELELALDDPEMPADVINKMSEVGVGFQSEKQMNELLIR